MSCTKWVPVCNYESRYEISPDGQVRVKARDIVDKFGNVVNTLEPVMLQPKQSGNFGPYVILHNGNKYQKELVKKLVKDSFINK